MCGSVIWFGVVRLFGLARFGCVGLVWRGSVVLVWFGAVRLRWFGLVWFGYSVGLVWLGCVVWFGAFGWFGLARFGCVGLV